MKPLDHLKHRVEELQSELHNAMHHLASVQEELNGAIKELQTSCNHKEYIYEAESDGHKTVRTYTCKMCGHWTRYCPENAAIV